MPGEEEKSLKPKQPRSKEAIDLAMKGKWQEAVELNKSIIESAPNDVEAYNRLGRAYIELGDFAQARAAYGKSVEIDPYNTIANRNLRRLKAAKEPTKVVVETDEIEPHQFIEEIGKAGVVNLYDLGPKEIRARMVNGDKLGLKVEGSSLAVYNGQGEYMGRVDTKHAPRLMRLMQGGNRYAAAMVRSSAESMAIIIRETYQHPDQAGKLSFPPKGLDEVRPFAADRVPEEEGEGVGEEDDSGYTIIGGDEVEVLPEESIAADDDTGNEDE